MEKWLSLACLNDRFYHSNHSYMHKLKYYISSFRLRTLPLSVAGIILGSLLARADGYFNIVVFCLALSTTLCLQILSNVCNELGDMQKGTDNEERLGPVRALQSGTLSVQDFKRMILIFTLLSLLSGIALVFIAFRSLITYDSLLLLAVGGAATLAAVKYTLGKKPYGYRGLGDIFVFLFFGGVSTLGAYYLMAHRLSGPLLLPASAMGFLITGVLNVNNIRDISNDFRSGKRTIPVILGEKKARIYHVFLITGGILCMSIYTLLCYSHPLQLAYLVTLPLFAVHLRKMYRYSGRALDPQLKFLSVSTLLFAVVSGIGWNL